MKAIGRPELNMRTLACIANIENFLSAHRWATTILVQVHLDAWVKGAEWSENNSYNTIQGT